MAPLGIDGRFAEGADGALALFTRAAWRGGDTLRVEQRWPEDASSALYELKFRGDEVEITRTDDFGQKSVLRGRRVAE